MHNERRCVFPELNRIIHEWRRRRYSFCHQPAIDLQPELKIIATDMILVTLALRNKLGT